MLLLNYNPQDLDGVKSVLEIYKVFGIGEGEQVQWDDESVFGEHGDVNNIFCTEQVFQRVQANFERNTLVGHEQVAKQMSYEDQKGSWDWAMYSPTTGGPRYELMRKALQDSFGLSDLPDDCIAIFQPEDPYYKPLPAHYDNIGRA